MQRKTKPWVSPYLQRCTAPDGLSSIDCRGDVGKFITRRGTFHTDLRNAIGSNPEAGFSFPKTKSDRLNISVNKKYIVHGGQACLAIMGTDVHAYCCADVSSIGGDGKFPWRGKGHFNKYPSTPHAVFGFSPRFYDTIKCMEILDGRPLTR